MFDDCSIYDFDTNIECDGDCINFVSRDDYNFKIEENEKYDRKLIIHLIDKLKNNDIDEISEAFYFGRYTMYIKNKQIVICDMETKKKFNIPIIDNDSFIEDLFKIDKTIESIKNN